MKTIYRLAKRGERRTGFTLTELLVVIIIMAVLIGAALPALRNLARSTGKRAALVQLKTTLSLARQWAITHRQRTYVVFPVWYSGISSNAPMASRAFAVFAVTNSEQGSGYYVKEWTYLPPGILFNTNVLTDTVFANSCIVTNVPFPYGDSPGRNLHAVTFKPDGSAAKSSDYRVYLREGWATVDPNTWDVDLGYNPTASNSSIRIYGLTGGQKVFHGH